MAGPVRKGSHPVTWFIMACGVGLSYTAVSLLSQKLNYKDEIFEKNVKTFIQRKMMRSRRIVHNKPDNPLDHLTSDSKAEARKNRTINKSLLEEREKTREIIEKYNLVKNSIYGFVFGGIGYIYNKQFTGYTYYKGVSMYSRLFSAPISILAYFSFCSLVDKATLPEFQESLLEHFFVLLPIKIATDGVTLFTRQKALRNFKTAGLEGKALIPKLPLPLVLLRYGMSFLWVYALVSRYEGYKPFVYF